MLTDEIKNIKSGKKELREFAFTVGIVLGIFGGIAWWRGKSFYPYLFVPGLILIFLGFVVPKVLKPIQRMWMILALLIGWVMSRVLLCLLFYLTVTPLGLLARALGKDFLDLEFKEPKESYWIERPRKLYLPSDYERQF